MSNAGTPRRGRPVLFERQRLLLALLEALGGSAGDLDFEMLLFLYCQEPDAGRPYEFVPHERGPFSFTAYADRRKLIERGFLAEDDRRWKLTDQGRAAISRAQRPQVTAFARRFRGTRGDALVAETYRRFPYVATRSELAAHVLHGDAAALARIEAARPVAKAAAVSTIGYEGRALEGYLDTLLRAGVTLLCDVRRNPHSHKYGFSKGTLARCCDGVGIRYEHLPELGIASEQRKGLTTQADYDALFAGYERTYLPGQTKSLAKIAGWVHAGERVALTCYELLPQHCHRHYVARALQRKYGEAFAASDL